MVVKTDLKCSYESIEKCNKSPAIGIRHLQIGMMFIVVTVLLIIRSSMGVAILAMTERKQPVNSTDNMDSANITQDIKEIYSETYDWNDNIQGVILSAFFWGYTINQIPGAVVAQKFGAKPVLLASLSINGFICLALPVLVKIGGWKIVFALRWLTGLTQCLFPCCHALLGKWIPPQERTTLSNVAYAGVQVGIIIAMPLCGVLARTALGWKMIFYTMAGLAFVTAIFLYFLAASSPAEHRLISERELKYIENSLVSHNDGKKSVPIPWRAILTSVPLAAILAANIGTAYAFNIFFTYIPSYMKNVLDISIRDSGILSMLPFLGMWIFATAMSCLCEYLSNNNILSLDNSRKLFHSIGSLGPAMGIIVLSFMTIEHSYLAISILTISVSLQGAVSSGFMMNHLDLSPTHAGIMFGITNSLSNLVGSLGPVMSGLILGTDVTDPSRWRILFFISAAIMVGTNIIYIIWTTTERQPWDDPSYNKRKPELDTLTVTKEETLGIYRVVGNDEADRT